MATRSKPILLVVHDDVQAARQISKMTSELADMLVARGAGRANEMLECGQQFDLVIVGRAGDGVAAIEILRAIRSKRPQARSVLLGAPRDLSASIEALHSGVVDHVLNPPLRERELAAILALPSPRPIPAAPTVTVTAQAKRAV